MGTVGIAEESTGGKRPRGRDKVRAVQPLLTMMDRFVAAMPRFAQERLLVLIRHQTTIAARAIRFCLARSLMAKCGQLVDIREGVYLFSIASISLGDRISIHPMCYIDGSGGLTVGNDVSIAHGVSILTTEHRWDDAETAIRDQGVQSRSVTIESDVWIGAGAKVLSGVRIGSGSIVAAGAVVTKDVASKSVVAGVPARVIGSRSK